MKASHGSIKKVDDIIGRKTEMKQIWKLLNKKSIVIASLRRMGKTCVLQKMCAFPEDGWKGIRYFVQGVQSPQEFVDGLYKILVENGISEEKFSKLRRWYEKNIGGKSFGTFKAPEFQPYWKELLETMISDIAQMDDEKIVIMIDEFPMMLWEFINTNGLVQEAKELLDTLRALREKYEHSSGLRFIFCGSIGMNVILDKLQSDHKYTGEPINNMHKENVLEMNDEDAELLCDHLYPANLSLKSKNDLITQIIKETDRLPFFIDLVFTKIQQINKDEMLISDIDHIIEELLNDPNKNNEFDHFYNRIKIYYNQDDKNLALNVLDILSKYDIPVEEGDIIKELKHIGDVDERHVKEVLKLLYEDLYLLRTISKNRRYFIFRYTLLRRWWNLNYA